MTTEYVQSAYSHYIIIGCSVLGLVWGGINALFVSNLKITAFFTYLLLRRCVLSLFSS